jgi:hypothetical protein
MRGKLQWCARTLKCEHTDVVGGVEFCYYLGYYSYLRTLTVNII